MRIATASVWLVLTTVAAIAQKSESPQWVGTWVLDLSKSDRAAISELGLVPVSQLVRLRQTATELEIAGETLLTGDTTARREETRLHLNGTPTTVGPVTLSLARIDDSTFEIVSRATVASMHVMQVSRFIVSPDGGTLTETKTRIERSVVQPPADPDSGPILRKSSATLLFRRSATPERQQ